MPTDEELKKAVTAERERCAKVADSDGCDCGAADCAIEKTAKIIAKRIRALAS